MKYLTRFRLFLIMLLLIICGLMVACQTVLPTATPTPMSVGMAGTATVPQETPAAAPTEDGAWPLSPDQHLMAAQTHDGAWWLWDTTSRRPVYLLNDTAQHAPSIHHPTFSIDGHYLAAISLGHVLLWDVASRKRRMLMPPQSKDFRSLRWLVFSPDSHLLATSSCERQSNHMICDQGFVSLWNTSDGTLAHTLPTGFRVDAMTFSADGSTLAVSGCSRIDSVVGSYCYEQSQMTYSVDNGERIALTRVPKFK